MIVEETETRANDRLAVAGGIPSQSKARGNILIVAGDAFDDAEGLFRGGIDRGCRCEERADFHVVSYAVVQAQLAAHAPTVLQKETKRKVVKGLIGIADSLDERGWNSETVGLKAGRARNTGTKKGQPAKIKEASEIEFEDLFFCRAELNEVTVTAHFEGVLAADEGDDVREFEPPLVAIDSGVGFPAKIGKPGHIDSDPIATRKLREAEVQSAASDL